MWRPYFTNANWDPYGSGSWAYYPSAGYSWVSPYPWGWTPYHSGNWNYCQGVGWGWQPGNTWFGLANNTLMNSTGNSGTIRPRPPVHAPTALQSSVVPVNLKALPVSTLSGANDKFVFRNNSAGLGVPRGNFGKLNGFANQTSQHGMATTNVYYGGQRSASMGEARAGSAGSPGGYSASSRASSNAQSSMSSMGASHASGASAPSGGSGGGAHR
jgi:hypothetical protein